MIFCGPSSQSSHFLFGCGIEQVGSPPLYTSQTTISKHRERVIPNSWDELDAPPHLGWFGSSNQKPSLRSLYLTSHSLPPRVCFL